MPAALLPEGVAGDQRAGELQRLDGLRRFHRVGIFPIALLRRLGCAAVAAVAAVEGRALDRVGRGGGRFVVIVHQECVVDVEDEVSGRFVVPARGGQLGDGHLGASRGVERDRAVGVRPGTGELVLAVARGELRALGAGTRIRGRHDRVRRVTDLLGIRDCKKISYFITSDCPPVASLHRRPTHSRRHGPTETPGPERQEVRRAPLRVRVDRRSRPARRRRRR